MSIKLLFTPGEHDIKAKVTHLAIDSNNTVYILTEDKIMHSLQFDEDGGKQVVSIDRK